MAPKTRRNRGADRVRCRALVVIDETPIRRRAIGKCRNVLKRFDEVAADIDRCRNVDMPAFQQWLHATFAAELTEIRELSGEIERLQDLTNRIEYLHAARRLSYHRAWREAASSAEEEAEEGEPDREDDPWSTREGEERFWEWDSAEEEPDSIDQEELWELFCSMLDDLPGYDGIDPDPEELERLFAEFRASFRSEFGYGPDPEEQAELPVSDPREEEVTLRLKALYRSLAKKLHPDFRQGANVELDDLWHNVQVAYQDGDLDALHALRACFEIRSRGDIAGLPVSQILAVHGEHKERLADLRRLRGRLRDDPAWGFSEKSKPDIDAMRANLKGRFEDEVGRLLMTKAYFDNLLERWSKPPKDGSAPRKRSHVPPNQSSLF